MSDNWPQTITEFDKSGQHIALKIEPYDFPDSVNLSEDYGVLTDCYEVIAEPDGLLEDLNYSIHEVDGMAFRVTQPSTLRAITILTEHVYADDGDIEDITIPDEPYDVVRGFRIGAGDYRIWDTGETH